MISLNYKASSSPEEVAAFRPAPFPIYEVDRHRITLRRVLCAVALACFALVGFAPVKAGVCVLSVPVRYTRVELEQRSPVVLDLDFLAADVSVAPASLGYLTGKGQFLYTADVPRGLLYARGEEGVVVIEVVAPRNVEVFVDDYLQNIRGRLTELNRKQNLLELARKSAPADSDMQDHLIAEMWNALTPGYSGPELDDISHDALAIRGGQLAWLTAEISRDARHRARLKRLYYQTQLARLDLLASELDLQLALSLLPKPDMDILLSLGNRELVEETFIQELSRLQTAWSSRQEELTRDAASYRQWLGIAERRWGGLPARKPYTNGGRDARPTGVGTASAIQSPASYLGPPLPLPPAAEPDPRTQLELSVATARLVVATAELDMLEAALDSLQATRRHVMERAVSSVKDVPRRRVARGQLLSPQIEELEGYATVEALAAGPEDTAALVLELAKCFETGGRRMPLTPAYASLPAVSPSPDELAYGLLAVDCCTKQEGSAGVSPAMLMGGRASMPAIYSGQGRPPFPGPPAATRLTGLLDEMLASPADYGAASFNLGYLQFIRWYAVLADQVAGEASQ